MYCSPSCKEASGREAKEFDAAPGLLRQVVHPDDLKAFDAHVEGIEAQKRKGNLEFRIAHADGSVRWMDHVCVPVFDAGGRYLWVRASNKDITENKLQALALLEQKAQLESTLARTKRLEGTISICMTCKRIHTTNQAWEQLESYFGQHTDAVFSHGICPVCASEFERELDHMRVKKE